jgi:hypothetical protein
MRLRNYVCMGLVWGRPWEGVAGCVEMDWWSVKHVNTSVGCDVKWCWVGVGRMSVGVGVLGRWEWVGVWLWGA